MAIVKKGIRGLAESNLVPEDEYTLKVLQVRDAGDSGWEVARCAIDGAEASLAGRRIDIFLLNEGRGDYQGLNQVLMAACLTEVPKDENGEQNTKTSLVGVTFPARVKHNPNGKRGPEARAYPILDPQWVEENMAGEAAGSGRSVGKARSRRSPRTRSAPKARRRR